MKKIVYYSGEKDYKQGKNTIGKDYKQGKKIQ